MVKFVSKTVLSDILPICHIFTEIYHQYILLKLFSRNYTKHFFRSDVLDSWQYQNLVTLDPEKVPNISVSWPRRLSQCRPPSLLDVGAGLHLPHRKLQLRNHPLPTYRLYERTMDGRHLASTSLGLHSATKLPASLQKNQETVLFINLLNYFSGTTVCTVSTSFSLIFFKICR